MTKLIKKRTPIVTAVTLAADDRFFHEIELFESIDQAPNGLKGDESSWVSVTSKHVLDYLILTSIDITKCEVNTERDLVNLVVEHKSIIYRRLIRRLREDFELAVCNLKRKYEE